MNPFEQFLLQFVKAALPTVENLFVHNARSIAIFNASEPFANAVIDAASSALAAKQSAPTPIPAPAAQ